MTDRVMTYGRFYGALETQCSVAGFDVAVRSVDPVRAVVRHSHEFAHFVLVLDGLYLTAAAGAPAFATGPTLIYNPPHVTHRDRFEHDGSAFRGRFMTVTVPAEHATDMGPVMIGGEAVARALELTTQCTRRGSDMTLAVEGLLIELSGAVSAVPVDERRMPQWLQRAMQRLGDAGDAPTVAELAAEADVHPVHFARTFRRFTGTTPAEFRRARRTERAMGLLRHTARTLSDIAVSCGFVDQSHLTRAVKRASGVTPGDVRGRSRA